MSVVCFLIMNPHHEGEFMKCLVFLCYNFERITLEVKFLFSGGMHGVERAYSEEWEAVT